MVGKEMYSFQDRGDRSCTAAGRHRFGGAGCSAAWFASQGALKLPEPMFRYSAPRRAGSDSSIKLVWRAWAERARSDVEVIALAWDLLAGLGAGGMQLELNSLGTSEDRQAYRKALRPGSSSVLRRSIPIPRQGSAPTITHPRLQKQGHPGATGRCTTLADALFDASRERLKRCS